MASTLDHAVDLKQFFRVLWRRKWLVVLTTVATVCATIVTLAFVPRQYQSSATMIIEDRRPMVAQVEQAIGGMGGKDTGYRADEQRMARIVGYVHSRPFLERVVKILKMNDDPAVMAAARARKSERADLTTDEIAVRLLVDQISDRVQVGTAGPGLYRFMVRDYSPRNAQLLAKWISELFIDMTTQRELEQLRAARSFGAEQLRIYQDQLKRSEDALAGYQSSLISQQLSDKLVRSDNLPAAEDLEKRLSDDAATAQARVGPFSRSVLDAGLSLDQPVIRQDPEVTGLIEKFSSALDRQVEFQLSGSTTPGGASAASAALAGARTQLYQTLENKVADAYPQENNEAHRALATYIFADIDATVQRREAAALQGGIDALTRRARSAPANTAEVERLKGEVERNRQLLQTFQAQMVASDISQAAEAKELGLQLEIVDPAQYPLAPSWPDARKIIGLAILMGPILGVGFSFLTEMLDPTLRSLEQIERVAPEPVLGTLPLIDAVLPRPRGLRRYWIPVTLAGVVLVTAVFFVARATVLPNLGPTVTPVKTVEPEESLVR